MYSSSPKPWLLLHIYVKYLKDTSRSLIAYSMEFEASSFIYIDCFTLWTSLFYIDNSNLTSHPSTCFHPCSLALDIHPCNFNVIKIPFPISPIHTCRQIFNNSIFLRNTTWYNDAIWFGISVSHEISAWDPTTSLPFL